VVVALVVVVSKSVVVMDSVVVVGKSAIADSVVVVVDVVNAEVLDEQSSGVIVSVLT